MRTSPRIAAFPIILFLITQSWSQTVSVNFVGGSATPANANRGGVVVNPLAPTDVTGVIPAGNWNNAGTANDPAVVNTGANKAGTIADLADSTGASTGTSLTWTSNNAWSAAVTETGSDEYLMKGYLDTSNSSTTTVELGGIALASYDLYVYVEGGNGVSRVGRYEVYEGSGTGGSLLGTIHRLEDAAFWDGSFDQATGVDVATATTGDYIVFPGLTTSSITLAAKGANTGTPRAPLVGLQIAPAADPPPVINAFAADDKQVAPGDPVTLTWDVENATTITLDPDGIDVTGTTSLVVNPAATTTYKLSANNGGPTVQATVEVHVGPVINAFAADDTYVDPGAPVTLTWNVEDATTLTLDPGGIDVTGTTSLVVNPVESTAYTLFASDVGTTVQASVVVTVSIPGLPMSLAVSNSGFESPAVGSGNSGTVIDGWVRDAAAVSDCGLIDDSATGINAAKAGSQWMFLDQERSVGTHIGSVADTVFHENGADRLFVGFWLTTIQNGEPNAVDVTVSLLATSSSATWEGGTLIGFKRIQDLTNDNRGEPNSYLDAYAVLPLDQTAAQAAGTDYWIVFHNNLSGVAGTGRATIDEVIVNVAGPPPARTLQNPNILIVFQDDMGYGDASFMNPDSRIQTPHLDLLASQGMAFTDAHSTATVCGPSRVALLTGTAPDKLGVNGNIPNGRFGPPGVDHNTQTIADLCQSAGYDTAVMGKWGIASYWPDRRFDGNTTPVTDTTAPTILDFSKPLENADRFGFAYRFIYDEKRPFILGETTGFEGDATPYGWHENGFAVDVARAHNENDLHEYYLRAITDRALRYIQTKAGLRTVESQDFRLGDAANQAADSFLLHYLTHAPHTPIVPADQFLGSSQAGTYGDFVVNLDYSLGRLMGCLDESGLADGTLVVFSSDNGPENSAYNRITNYGHYSMGALRGVKRDLYEGGHRVPLVVRWPGMVEAGSVSNAMVSLCDWFATVADITGQTPPDTSGLDSMSILPVLKGDVREVRGLMLQDTAIGVNSRAIRSGPWIYIDAATGALNSEPEWFKTLRDVIDAPGNELYNLAANISEGYNRIAINAAKAAEMDSLHNAKWPAGVRSTPPFAAQGDSDGDGFSDFFEDVHGLDKGDPDDAGTDADGDGLNTAAEVLAGSDPTLYDTDGDTLPDGAEAGKQGGFPTSQWSDPTLQDRNLDGTGDFWDDQDMDGIPDASEWFHTGDLSTLGDGNSDLDGDGATDVDEALAGTDPTDRNSQFRIEGVLEGSSRDEISWQSAPQRTYKLERSINLLVWSMVQDGIPSQGWESRVPDSDLPLPGAFYRVSVDVPLP